MLPKETNLYIPVNEVFPEIKNDFETFKSLLGCLSRTDTLFRCARLNGIISNASGVNDINRQQYALDRFLNAKEIRAVNDFAQRNGGAQRVKVFFRGQLLELVRWGSLYCSDHPGYGRTEDSEIRRKFAQAALIASEIWEKRVFGERLSDNGDITIRRQKALGSFRKSLEATDVTPDLYRTLGRGWVLFNDYFPIYYRTVEYELLSLTGLSIEQYYCCLCAITSNFMNPNNIEPGIFDSNTLGTSTPYAEVIQKYLALESQTIDELRDTLWGDGIKNIKAFEDVPPYDYRPLRERPILRSSEGRGIILDPIFFSERASVGPLFLLSKNKPENKANDIFNAFGKSFENYASDILRRMFPEIPGLFNRLSCNLEIFETNQSDNMLEIDACLNEVTEVVLFEMKAVWLREEEILTEDHARYLQHLREKYGVAEGTCRDRKIKGVGQLAKQIKVMASKGWLEKNEKFSKIQLIYPVLVVHDTRLSEFLHGNFLASEFKALLAPDDEPRSGELKKGQLRIAPLIVMTIEELEDLETSVEYFSLRDLIADYSQSCPDRLQTLHNFIYSSKYYSQHMCHNQRLVDKFLVLLQRCKEEVFPTG